MKPTFFKNTKELRRWLKKNHLTKTEFWLGFYKTKSSKFNHSWSEAVDELLCFGWIDGLKKSIDEESYMHRITPRKLNSNWSRVNLEKVIILKEKGRMFPKGLEVYNNRKTVQENQYSFEKEKPELKKEYSKKLESNNEANSFFKTLSPTAQKHSIWWVMSAKKEETKIRRLNILIQSSVKKEKIPPLNWTKKNK